MSFTTRTPAVVFMYLLLRDELAAGVVERLLKQALEKPRTGNPRGASPFNEDRVLSSEHLGELAQEMCERLDIECWQ